MAAVEVPVLVAFNNEASKIRLEPESGPNAQPVLSFVLSMQIPIAALLNALAEFQSKYDAEHAAPEPAPGLLAPPPLAEDARCDSESEPFDAERALGRLAWATPGRVPGIGPASAVPAVAPKPVQIPAEAAELHNHNPWDNNLGDHAERTDWSKSATTSRPLLHLADESCLVNFVATPFSRRVLVDTHMQVCRMPAPPQHLMMSWRLSRLPGMALVQKEQW